MEGFHQVLELAGRVKMNFRNPRDKTPELFERFLPYAAALGGEQHWMERFAGFFVRLEESGEHYRPVWCHGLNFQVYNLDNFSRSLETFLSSALSSSPTAPSSSSGSGGAGFSGGRGVVSIRHYSDSIIVLCHQNLFVQESPEKTVQGRERAGCHLL